MVPFFIMLTSIIDNDIIKFYAVSGAAYCSRIGGLVVCTGLLLALGYIGIAPHCLTRDTCVHGGRKSSQDSQRGSMILQKPGLLALDVAGPHTIVFSLLFVS